MSIFGDFTQVFINKSHTGTNNLIGSRFADRLQLLGLDIDKNAIQRIECGKRFVTDIELVYICKALEIDPNTILEWE